MSFRRGLSLSPSACGALKNMLVRQQQKNICRPRIEYCGPVAAGYQPMSTVRRWKTNDASSKHAEFQKQMLELEEEQIQLFGRGGEDVGGTVSELERLGASSAGDEKFQEQVSEVNEEQTKLFGTGDVDGGGEGDVSEMERLGNDRQHLFEFTSEDMDAWRGRNIPKNADTPTARPADPPAPSAFTHLAEERGAPVARMVDVSSKSPGAKRSATARATVRFPPEIVTELGLPSDGGEAHGPKGPIFATARLAGIMAAKRTSELIPLCHPLSLSCVEVDVRMEGSSSAVIECTATLAGGRTGVEMEALTGASVAALTVYDMCKAVSHRIEWSVELLRKEGGKRGTIDLEEENQ